MNPETVPATIDFEAASAAQWDIIIAGAGIAGIAAAGMLARRGKRVLLLERKSHPRHKTCGGCLGTPAVSALERNGFGEALRESSPHPLRQIAIWQNGRERTRFDFSGSPRPAAIARNVLDAAMLRQSIASGAEYLDHAQAVDTDLEEDVRTVSVRRGNGYSSLFRADCLIDATGLGGHLARRAGVAATGVRTRYRIIGLSAVVPADLFPRIEKATITMLCARQGYIGITHSTAGLMNIAAAINAVSGGKNLMQVLSDIVKYNNFSAMPLELLTSLNFCRCPPLRQGLTQPHAERLLVLGDAAGYIEPITGEGMAWALSAAEAVASVLVDGWKPGVGIEYARLWRQTAGRRKLVRLTSGLLRSTAATAATLALLSAAPPVRAAIERSLMTPPTLQRRSA